jgi:hypothetical protein
MNLQSQAIYVHKKQFQTTYMGLNEIIGATRVIEGSAYWIALVVSWMQTLRSVLVMPKISPISGTRCLPKP